MILGKTKDFYACLALISMLLILVKRKLNFSEFGNHFILNSTEIKLKGEKISKLIDHNLLSRNPFSNGVIEKSLQ